MSGTLSTIQRGFWENRARAFRSGLAIAAGFCALFSGTPAAGNSEAPLVLLPGKDLEELFGYAPEYTQNIPTFDRLNRPYIRSRSIDLDETKFIHTFRDGKWVERSFIPAIREAFPDFERTFRGGGWFEPRAVFDTEDRFYTQVRIQLKGGGSANLLVYSSDLGETFGVVELPAGAVIAEHRSGHNRIDGPPFLMILQRLRAHPATYASWNRLSVTQPHWENGKIVIPEPIVVSEDLVGLEQHSGGSSFAVTRDGITHFVWGAATEGPSPEGMPTFIASYSHKTGTVSKPLELTRQIPANNAHNMPGLVVDSDGFLHVVTGTHGRTFFYLKSLKPNDISGGWTEPAAVLAPAAPGQRVGQSYVSLLCDNEDTLHLVYRHWRRDLESYPHLDPEDGAYYGVLAYQRKPKGEPWSESKPLIVPSRAEYSIYYHRASLDRQARLFVSASYYDRALLNRSTQERFHHRMLLISEDRGKTFRLANPAASGR